MVARGIMLFVRFETSETFMRSAFDYIRVDVAQSGSIKSKTIVTVMVFDCCSVSHLTSRSSRNDDGTTGGGGRG